MISIDVVIESLPTLTENKRAILAKNASRIVDIGPGNKRHADAVRLLNAITAFEALRPAKHTLINVEGLDWDRMVKGRTTFRGFDGDRLVARITRIQPGTFSVRVPGAQLPHTFSTLSAARSAAADAHRAGAADAPVALPRAA